MKAYDASRDRRYPYTAVYELLMLEKTDEALADPSLSWLEEDIDDYIKSALRNPHHIRSEEEIKRFLQNEENNQSFTQDDESDNPSPNTDSDIITDDRLIAFILTNFKHSTPNRNMLRSTGLSDSVMKNYIAKRLQVIRPPKE